MAPIPVWILSDHRLFGEGLRMVLSSQPGLAVELLALSSTPGRPGAEDVGTPPEILILDAQAPDALGLCSHLARRYVGAAVLLVGAFPDEAWAIDALRAGARGILPRSTTLEDLLKAIRVVRDRQIWAPKSVVARALDMLSGVHNSDDGHLTPRERDVLNHLLRGLSNREIAERAAISQATVKAHVTSIFRKLSVRDRTQLVVRYQGLEAAASPRYRPRTS